jgi:hypothetical protein
MKKLLVVLLLLNTPAWAEWTRVDANEDLDAYVDLATIHRKANIVGMSALLDYKTSHQWSDYLLYWSMKTQKEFDCDAGQYHTLNSVLHFEHMGAGPSVYEVPGGASWRPVPVEGIDEFLWKFACKQ